MGDKEMKLIILNFKDVNFDFYDNKKSKMLVEF